MRGHVVHDQMERRPVGGRHRETHDARPMMKRVGQQLAIDRHQLMAIVRPEHHHRRRPRQLAGVDILEDVEDGETVRLILRGEARLLGHREIGRRRVDAGDHRGGVAVMAGALAIAQQRAHHLRCQPRLEREDVDAIRRSPLRDDEQPRPGGEQTDQRQHDRADPPRIRRGRQRADGGVHGIPFSAASSAEPSSPF